MSTMKEERTPDMIDSDNLRLAMETGTLPPSGELKALFSARRPLGGCCRLPAAVRVCGPSGYNTLRIPRCGLSTPLQRSGSKSGNATRLLVISLGSATGYRCRRTGCCKPNIILRLLVPTGCPNIRRICGNGRNPGNGATNPAGFKLYLIGNSYG